jgi:hypothetical protein
VPPPSAIIIALNLIAGGITKSGSNVARVATDDVMMCSQN